MINFNGTILSDAAFNFSINRGFLYGDAVFETLKVVDNKILFFEDHYFRLMASMRIVRMKIPSSFTLEFLESEILNLVKTTPESDSFRVRFSVYRNNGGYYMPLDNSISYLITQTPLKSKKYTFNNENYQVDLFKDFFITKHLLSSIKTNNKMVNVTASIFAKENDLQNCLLLNNEKNVVETIIGNLFMLKENKLITPPISDGCLNGIMRKQIINLITKNEDIHLVEESISPFDIQKADELFTTNIILGVQPITQYRKKEFSTSFSKSLLEKINQLI
jgi:branched-chain amino acid aminotransferase